MGYFYIHYQLLLYLIRTILIVLTKFLEFHQSFVMFCWIWMLFWTMMTIITAVIANRISEDKLILEGKCSYSYKYYESFLQLNCPPNGIVTKDNQIAIIIPYGGIQDRALNLICSNYLPILNTTIVPILPAYWLDLTNEIEHITVIKCLLPNNFQSILLNNFGLTNLENIVFTWTKLENVSLNKESIKLNSLTKLVLRENHFAQLDDGVFSDLGNLMYLNLTTNGLKNIPDNLFDSLNKLVRLDLSNNEIEIVKSPFKNLRELTHLFLQNNKIHSIKEDSLQNLIKLQVLRLEHNNLKNLPSDLLNNNPSLKEISLNNNDGLLLLDYQFANLTSLSWVDLSYLNLSEIPENIFHKCTELSTLNLEWNKLIHIPKAFFTTNVRLQTVKLNNNALEALPDDLFTSSNYIEELYLHDNLIESISKKLFRKLYKLNYISLERNKIKHIDYYAFKNNKKVKTINLSYNMLTELDSNLFETWTFIKHMNLSHNLINKAGSTLGQIYTYKGKYRPEVLDVSYNYISPTDVEKLIQQAARTIRLQQRLACRYLDIQFNNISAILIDVLPRGKGKQIIDIGNNKAPKCLCKLLDMFNISNPHGDSIRCRQPYSEISTVSNNLKLDDLSCPLNELYEDDFLCPKNCSCNVKTYTKMITVNCSEQNLTTLPNISLPESLTYNYFELILDGNNLQNVPDISLNPQLDNVSNLVLKNNKIRNVLWIPSKLRILDLSGNRLEKLDSEIVKNFERLKKVNLGKNPWTCDCNIAELVYLLRSHTEKFNVNNIKCKGTNQLLIDLDLIFLCYYVHIYSTIAFLIVLIIFSTLTTLYYRYQEQIEIFLYAHKMCMCFIRSEEEVDRNKEYDAFIIHSHEDDRFVEELKSVLENPINGYRLCIHHRNWEAGLEILDQVVASVLSSRRAIVVLSNKFLQSNWGICEFKMAHTEAMKEGRTRVIVIFYGIVRADIELLDDDILKNYINHYTYIEWGDRWFWEKLLYAMPHDHCNKNRSRANRVELTNGSQPSVSIAL